MTENDLPRNVYAAPFEVERPEKASMSLLKRVDLCPYSASLYLRHKGGPQTPRMAAGEVAHQVFERIINLAIESGEQTVPPEVAKDIAQATIEERVDIALPEAEHESIRIAAWNFGTASIFDPAVIVGVEQMFELPVGDFMVRGKLDLAEIVNGQGVISDWKNSLYVPPQEAVETDFQLRLYALTLAEGTPEGEDTPLGKRLSGVHAKLVFPRHDPKQNGGNLVTRSAYFDRAQLYDFKRGLEAALAKLEHGLDKNEWAASPGTHCMTCPASSECPIPTHLRTRTIGTADDALEVSQRLAAIKREEKALRDPLKAWCDENGELVDGDEVWTFKLTQSERADKDAIRALIEEAERGYEEFFKQSQSTRFIKQKVKEDA